MNWRKIRALIVAFLAAFLLILVTGVAIAEGKADLQIFKIGNNVIVPAGRVMTDVVAIGGDVILKPNARVGGDAVAIGGQIVKETGALVEGNEVVAFSNAKVLLDRFGLFGTIYLTNVLFFLTSLMVILAFGIFLLLLLPDQIKSITATMHQYPFESGIWGLVSIVAITLFTALFSGSVFGFLLIPIVNLAFVVAGLLGAITLRVAFGS